MPCPYGPMVATTLQQRGVARLLQLAATAATQTERRRMEPSSGGISIALFSEPGGGQPKTLAIKSWRSMDLLLVNSDGVQRGERREPVRHVMVDIETLSMAPGATITAIGAVRFELDSYAIDLHSGFYASIHAPSGIDDRRRVDGHGIVWWRKQSDATRTSVADPSPTLATALANLRRWYIGTGTDEAPQARYVWGHGFDPVQIEHANGAVDKVLPWPSSVSRELRTLIDAALGPITRDEHGAFTMLCRRDIEEELRRTLVEHHALDDALLQARMAQIAWRAHEDGDLRNLLVEEIAHTIAIASSRAVAVGMR